MASVGFFCFLLMGILFQMVVADMSKEYKKSLDNDITMISTSVNDIKNKVSTFYGLNESVIMPNDGVSMNIASYYNRITLTTINLEEFFDLSKSILLIELMKPTALNSTLKNKIEEYSLKLAIMARQLRMGHKTDRLGYCKAYWRAQDHFYAHSVGVVLTDIEYFAVLKAAYQFACIKDDSEKRIQTLGKEHEKRVKDYMQNLFARTNIPEAFQHCEDLIREETEMSKIIYKLNMFYLKDNYFGSFPEV